MLTLELDKLKMLNLDKNFLSESLRGTMTELLTKAVKEIGGTAGERFIQKLKDVKLYTTREIERIEELVKKTNRSASEETELSGLLGRAGKSQQLSMVRKLISDKFSSGIGKSYIDNNLLSWLETERIVAYTRTLPGKSNFNADMITRDDVIRYIEAEVRYDYLTEFGESMGNSPLTDEVVRGILRKVESNSSYQRYLNDLKRVVPVKYKAGRWSKFFEGGLFNGAIAEEFFKRTSATVRRMFTSFCEEKFAKKLEELNDKLIEELDALFSRDLTNVNVEEELSEITLTYSTMYKKLLLSAYDLDDNTILAMWTQIKNDLKTVLKESGISDEQINEILIGIEKESNQNSKLSIEMLIQQTSKKYQHPILAGVYSKDRGFMGGGLKRWVKNISEKYGTVKKIAEDNKDEFTKRKVKKYTFYINQWLRIFFSGANLVKRIIGWTVYGNINTLKDMALMFSRRGTRSTAAVWKNFVVQWLYLCIFHLAGSMVYTFFKAVFYQGIEVASGGSYETAQQGVKDAMIKYFSDRFMSGFGTILRQLIPFGDSGHKWGGDIFKDIRSLVLNEGGEKLYQFIKDFFVGAWETLTRDTYEKYVDQKGNVLKNRMDKAGLSSDRQLEALKTYKKLEKERNNFAIKANETSNEEEKVKFEKNAKWREKLIKDEVLKLEKRMAAFEQWEKAAKGIIKANKIVEKSKGEEFEAIVDYYSGSVKGKQMPAGDLVNVVSGLHFDINYGDETQLIKDYQNYMWDNRGGQAIVQAQLNLQNALKNKGKIYYTFKDGTKWKVTNMNSSLDNIVLDFQEVKPATYKTKKVGDFYKKLIDTGMIKENNLKNKLKNIISEMIEGKKFGEDNFKHWKDTFKFKKYDEKTNQLKDVKITSKMDEIMDRINHFRKKYDEDDSFVRAVIDVYGTGIDIIQYTKGLAHLSEGVIVEGLMSVLANLREAKELVTWTVKHYKDGNWELVKGNFNKQELLNVGKTKRERDERQKESDNPTESLKKKEQEAIMILKRDEKEGLKGLPTKVKEKVKEKLRQGWTTETPFDFLSDFYTVSEINSVFNDKIKVYKLRSNLDFFKSLSKNSSKINIKKGFCKSIRRADMATGMEEKEKTTYHNFVTKCKTKFGV